MTESSVPAVIVPSVPAPKRSLLGYWVLLFTFLIMLGATGLAVRNMKRQLKTDIKNLEVQLNQEHKNVEELTQSLDEAIDAAKRRIDNNLNNHQARLGEIENRLQDHQNRLQSLTNRTLDERLLAEAFLLLKQANQRLLLHHDVIGAQLLLTETEELLNNSFSASGDAQFLALRQTLSRESTALRMIKPLDKQGLYLQLSALIDLIPQLPTQPKFEKPSDESDQPLLELDSSSTWRDWVSNAFTRFRNGLKNYIRLDDRTDVAKPILDPQSAKLMQLNLQLLLEQAQVALLEQQSVVYQQSLTRAAALLNEYFWEAESISEYRQSLQQLAQQEVAPPLPTVSESLELLQGYIERKHETKAVEVLQP